MNEFIYGIHAVQSIFSIDPTSLLIVYFIKEDNDYHNKRRQHLIQKLKNAGIIINMVNRSWFDHKFKGAVHQGIIAKVNKINYFLPEKDLKNILEQKKKILFY